MELDKTETEIKYNDDKTQIADYLVCVLGGEKVGVSVTRACGLEFNAEEALKLLTVKLTGINESSKNVSETDQVKCTK